MKKESCEGFRCPEFIPPNVPDDFCIPEECCPERFDTFKFPSPTSCLPEEVLEALELRIERANQFLLDLALSNEREKNEIFRHAFQGLIGQEVKLELDCPALGENGNEASDELPEEEGDDETDNLVLSGRVFVAGKDFTILRNAKKEIVVPHEKICFIRPMNRFAEPIDTETLNDIDPCLRRCITYRFGEVVSGSPQLIQIFFNLTLRVHLLNAIDKNIIIRTGNEIVEGTVFDVDEEQVILCIDDEKRMIGFADACFIEIEDC